ncbi:hypothetical protein ACIGZJ_30865 [Kitasatospora sp. NPDC052868]|uniref:hypothetical protein n=1 Tax=Kitasatospora sp. NPDC052868 TaxID=3364060 RepID=UPI0037CA532B
MSTDIPSQRPAPATAIAFPRQRSIARDEGRDDAFDEPRWLIAARIADMRDCATAYEDGAALRFAEDYAAGALTTWTAIDALHRALGAIEER